MVSCRVFCVRRYGNGSVMNRKALPLREYSSSKYILVTEGCVLIITSGVHKARALAAEGELQVEGC